MVLADIQDLVVLEIMGVDPQNKPLMEGTSS